ncbi:type I-C CRISPR-associated endonuclease Cas1 [Alicyclobacillaceae bacterium I2511]|nr:type I-C CRISPR-associated endonuclease Cas1 [Alicyclobacillaceae bacterium I2511]
MIQQALNTLYVQTEGVVLRLDHDNVVAMADKPLLRVPLHHLHSIVAIGRVSLTSPLLARCAQDGRSVVMLNTRGKFLYRIVGPTTGNVLLRIAQQRLLQQPENAIPIVQAVIAGKLHNCRQVLLRSARESSDDVKRDVLKRVAEEMMRDMRRLSKITDLDVLRGVEGINARRYFSQMSNMLREGGGWSFSGRNRRPPRDSVNALLSFLYALLGNDLVAAAESVGLDPQVGFLHSLRPGRPALALDMMEEMRPILADRVALTLINRQQLGLRDFDELPGGAVRLNELGRRTVLQAYQERKQDTCRHPLLKKTVTFEMAFHIQTRLMARAIRKDVPYFPFLYK